MPESVEERVERSIRNDALLEPGGEVACLVSGGADSTCLWHLLGALGYRVRAVHVHHGLRGSEADADAEHCAATFGAEVVQAPPAATEAELRDLRYRLTGGRGVRATGHTASDQVETVLYRIVSSGSTRGIRARRADGVVRPLLPLWREETETYCRSHGLAWRNDATNPGTKRGLIRDRLLPLLEELDPRARANLLALADEPPRLPRALERSLVELCSSLEGTRGVDLGRGIRAVRAYRELRLEGAVEWGPWTIESDEPGLVVRSRRPGDRIAGRSRKVQDVLVDAKVPRRDRDEWPLVATEDGAVVAVPGLETAPGWEGAVSARRAGS
ncbi:MAG TPA: tRNA lysidine(34) synthetase TilS [Gaiella sp.]|jgi:tRNA(Ile)-lysidine synthetase-like protein|nr:tRNA lysidine(34) synthetase TilS [Gaiella sp.]